MQRSARTCRTKQSMTVHSAWRAFSSHTERLRESRLTEEERCELRACAAHAREAPHKNAALLFLSEDPEDPAAPRILRISTLLQIERGRVRQNLGQVVAVRLVVRRELERLLDHRASAIEVFLPDRQD